MHQSCVPLTFGEFRRIPSKPLTPYRPGSARSIRNPKSEIRNGMRHSVPLFLRYRATCNYLQKSRTHPPEPCFAPPEVAFDDAEGRFAPPEARFDDAEAMFHATEGAFALRKSVSLSGKELSVSRKAVSPPRKPVLRLRKLVATPPKSVLTPEKPLSAPPDFVPPAHTR
jgi:hypothetical protein